MQTASRFISPEAAANDANFDPDLDSDNDNGISDLYAAYKNGLSDSVTEIAEANYSAAQSSYQHEVEHHRAVRMQHQATQQAANSSWENRVAQECKGFVANVAMLNLNAMHMFMHGLTAQNLMNPVNAMEEAYTGHNPLNGRSVGLGQAYVDFGESMATFAATDVGVLAEHIGIGVENLAVGASRLLSDIPSVGRNIASMFGRGGVSNSIANEFNNAVGSNIAKHPLDGWTPEQVMQHVNQLGLRTPRDQLILWSGLGRGDAGISLSQQYAAENGGITLEMTSGGKWLHEMDLFGADSPFTRDQTLQIWSDVSTNMIQQASGQVRSLVGIVKPSSIYREEQSELFLNKNILGLDELNLRPRYGFGNNK